MVVHNGIVENYVSLKKKLIEEGHRFTTESDTEVVAHLGENNLQTQWSPVPLANGSFLSRPFSFPRECCQPDSTQSRVENRPSTCNYQWDTLVGYCKSLTAKQLSKVSKITHLVGRFERIDLPQSSITLLSFYYCYLPRKMVGVLCALILCGILVAGLWPFHSPKNQVHWLGDQDGLRFGRYGTVLSADQFEPASSDGSSCSLEIWLKPARAWGTGTLLAFYDPLNRRQFSLEQDYTDLALRRNVGDEGQNDLNVDEIFRRKQALITVTSDGQDTAVYVDGNLVTRSSRFGLSLNDFGGQLILATSPLQSNSWSGKLLGLAIYKSELTAAQVAEHYQDWTQKGKPDDAENERTLALYLFDEHRGKVIGNQVGSGNDLYIPDRYRIVNQTLLEPPWTEFRTQRTYLSNALINIAGFVPLGFCFGAYFTSVRKIKHSTLATIVFGAIVSLTIEVLQAYLPTRDSGVTDLITNTFGTSLGAMVYCAAALPIARELALRHWTASNSGQGWTSNKTSEAGGVNELRG